jgi:hypothetical protein
MELFRRGLLIHSYGGSRFRSGRDVGSPLVWPLVKAAHGITSGWEHVWEERPFLQTGSREDGRRQACSFYNMSTTKGLHKKNLSPQLPKHLQLSPTSQRLHHLLIPPPCGPSPYSQWILGDTQTAPKQ